MAGLCAAVLPCAALGQTPPEPPTSPVVHRSLPGPLPTAPTSHSEVKRQFGVWRDNQFIPIGTNGQPLKAQDPEFNIDLEPPSPEKLFTVRGEAGLRQYVEEEYRKIDPNAKLTFPPVDPLVPPGVTFQGRHYPPSASTLVPAFLCHQPLYFEEKNAERYAWEMGVWQPLISAGTFYKDLALLPYKMGAECPWTCVTNAGKCLPGDCVPYTLYVSPFSWKGVAAETGTLIGGSVFVP